MLTVIQGRPTRLMQGHGIPAGGVTHTFILHSMTVCPHVSNLEREYEWIVVKKMLGAGDGTCLMVDW